MPARSRRRAFGGQQRRTRSSVLLARFLVLAVLVLCIGGVAQLIRAWGNRVWNHEERFTLVIASTPPVIASYQLQTGELTILPLPDNVQIVASFDAGTWKAERLYEVGTQKGMRGELLEKSLQNVLGIPIDGWIDQRGLALVGVNSPEHVRLGKSSPLSMITALFRGGLSISADSNLTVFDQLRVAFSFGMTPVTHRRVVYPETLGLLKETTISTGEEGWIPMFDASLPRTLVDSAVAQESVGIGLVNATDFPGLGKRLGRVIENLGAPLLWVKTEELDERRCLIKTNDSSRASYTVVRIKEFLGCTLRIEKTLSSPVEIIIGSEIAREFPAF